MSEPRKSAELRAIESGNKVRGRFKDDGAKTPDSGPIGKAPTYLNSDQRQIWYELRDIIAPGVLQASDIAAFEQLVILKASERQLVIEWNKYGALVLDPAKGKARPQYNVTYCALRQLRKDIAPLLDAFGLNPVARPRVKVPKAAPSNPLDKFLQA